MAEITRKDFVRLGATLGMGAAGASVLAACGGGASGGSGGGSGGNGGGSGNEDAASGSPETTQAQTSGEETAEEQASGGDGGESGGESGGGGTGIARVDDVAAGSAVSFEDGGQPAVLVHLGSGDFVAYSAVCTHQGCEVAFRNGQLACPCHGSVFDPANGGAVVTPPAEQPLPEIPVEVRGGEVFKA